MGAQGTVLSPLFSTALFHDVLWPCVAIICQVPSRRDPVPFWAVLGPSAVEDRADKGANNKENSPALPVLPGLLDG